ncbi:MAG: cation transporter [Bacteroidales bacterium]|jgi:copper chaperone CopZ
MKLKMFSLIALFLFGATAVFAGNKTETFKVFGNCGMCKARIEKAAKSVEGVSASTWDKETKMIEVTFDDAKTNMDKITASIVNAGHDTENVKAKDEVYNNLPGCCLYERAETKPEQNQE